MRCFWSAWIVAAEGEVSTTAVAAAVEQRRRGDRSQRDLGKLRQDQRERTKMAKPVLISFVVV